MQPWALVTAGGKVGHGHGMPFTWATGAVSIIVSGGVDQGPWRWLSVSPCVGSLAFGWSPCLVRRVALVGLLCHAR